MLTLFRWLVRLTIGLIVGGLLVVLLAWYFAVRSLPEQDMTLNVSGISAPVEIVRTTEDVPHIFAKSDADAFFALGLAHAQDRLFQMVVLRRAAQGRLAEIYGQRAVAADDLARRLGLWRNAERSVAAQDETTRAALSAYAAGVNAWIEEVNAGARGRGAPEFFLFPGDIAYWQPADSLAILKLVAAGATSQLRDEVMRAQLSLAAPDRAIDIVGAAGEPPLPSYAALFGDDARFPAPAEAAPKDWFNELAGYIAPGMGGSAGAWAADHTRTAAGAPILANDLNVALTAPSLWYLARIELSTGGAIGGTIPGIPAILSGRNPKLAWGLTPAFVDDQDIVMTEVQPGDGSRYLAARRWTPFVTRSEVIRVRDGEDIKITLRDTDSGPVIPGAHFGLGAVTPAGHVAALRWTGLSDRDTTMSALIGLMQAPDRATASTAVRGVVAPALQVTLADQGGIAEVLAGEVPRRPADHPTAGRMPSPARVEATRWLDPLAVDDPQRVSPPQKGIVAATGAGRTSAPTQAEAPRAATPVAADTAQPGVNAATDTVAPGAAFAPPQPAPATASGPVSLGYDRDSSLRLGRLDRLMDAREIHSRDSFIDAQRDVVSPDARALLPVVGADLWFSGEAAAPGTPERQRQDALALLAEWDGSMGEHLPEPLIYSAWMDQLQRRLVQDELGPLTGSVAAALRPAFIDRVFRNTGGAARWCDVVQSAPVEDCATIARQSLDAALVDLTARFGADVSSWRWGDLHEARHEHPGLGRMPMIGWVVSLVQSTSGDGSSLARAGTSGAVAWPAMVGRRAGGASGGGNPWANVTGAGYRGVYDLADPDSSVFVTSTGQSGHPLSRHYDDLAELWRRGEYIRMSLDPELARAGASGVTMLEPVGRQQ